MKKIDNKIDLLKLPADDVLKALSEKIVNQENSLNEKKLHFGGLVIKSIGSIALKNDESIVLSGRSDNNQGMVVKFGINDFPTINPKIKVIGIKQTLKEEQK